MSFLFTFLAVLLFLIGLFVLLTNQTVGLLMLGAAIVCVIISCSAKKHKEQKAVVSNSKNTSKSKSKTDRKRYAVKGYCISGLPFGECDCDITVYDDRVIFSTGKSASNLSTSKITAAAVKTKNELASASTGSAILGTALFGVVGTIIASRPKNKSQYILVINYISGELKTIAIAFDNYQKYEAENIAFFLNKKAASSVTEL